MSCILIVTSSPFFLSSFFLSLLPLFPSPSPYPFLLSTRYPSPFSFRLRSVPSHIHLISTLSVLNISHNIDIDTLPLEISNLEGLWSLEYDGVPLTNPPASDLDKFRSAADKLLYMRSLLHE